MTKRQINPLDKVVGLHVTCFMDDGFIINMTRRNAMKYAQTLSDIKESGSVENVSMIITSHRGFVTELEAEDIESMEVIAYDTLS